MTTRFFRHTCAGIAALAFAAVAGWTAWGAPALVPAPRQMKLTGGEHVAKTTWTGEIPIRETVDASLPSEGYRLVVSSGGVSVASADAAGAFYARQTLSQLSSTSNGAVTCPCVEVEDAPAFKWRGLLLDESRHFFGMDSVKRFLDLMAQHKLNVFHWHLTDNQGWRIEIDRHPGLTTVASRRPYSKAHKYILDSVPEGAPGEYGPFFYTKAQIREIVSFAAERHIRVIPEIEIPGHSRAVLHAFPDLLCFADDPSQKPTNAVDDVYCAGNDKAIRFLEDVLDEVCEMFPDPVIHIGGDEVDTANWEACPKCRARMEAVGAKTPEELQAWMNGHFADYVAKKGKRPIWWGENPEGEIPSGLAVMSWRSPDCGVAAAKKGHEVVMCPYRWTYFCYASAEPDDPAKYPYYSNRRIPASKVYEYDPLAGVPPECRKYVMGGEGCNWTEYTNSEDDLDWKCWTRAAALSEVLWTAPKTRDLGEFLPRLGAHVENLKKVGVNCSPATDVRFVPDSVTVGGEGFTNGLSRAGDAWTGHGVTVRIGEDGVVSVSAPSNGLSWVLLDWRRPWPKDATCLADTWERSYGNLAWQPLSEDAVLAPWYFLVNQGGRTDGYGVEVQPNALACWKVKKSGYALRLDLRAGSQTVLLGDRTLKAVRIVTRKGKEGESAFQAGRAFCRMMCPVPRLPKEPVYGYNDWYCAYGRNTATNFLMDAAYISKCAAGLANRPYVVMDDGWQEHSPPWMKENAGGFSSGMGPWDRSGTAFGMEMPEFCRRIAALDAKPGLWYRPLRAWPGIPSEMRQKEHPKYFDPTLSEVRRMIVEDVARFRGWGFKLVKIDYLTYDVCHLWEPKKMGDSLVQDGKATWRDRSRTTCEVMKDLYAAMREGAGDEMVIIGCNAINHLAAGFFEVQRIGNDTSGRKWEPTRINGVNTLGFRAIQDRTFFVADGDCCGLVAKGDVPWEKNSQWLDLLARSGTALFVSWSRELADDSFMKALVSAFRTASAWPAVGEPLDWMETPFPSRWRFADGDAGYEW